MSSESWAQSLERPLFLGLVLGITYTLWWLSYNVFLHPLRKFPGPISNRASVFPRSLHQMRGRLPFHVAALHSKYGSVVRVGPNELAFNSPQAWRDIYGHKKDEYPKSRTFYGIFKHLPSSIINADAAEHAMLRRQIAVGFSDRAMHEQEPIISGYVDLLISWYTWTTFDLIGDLSFGVEGGFGCLQNSRYHPWVKWMHDTISQNGIILGLISLGLTSIIPDAMQPFGVGPRNCVGRNLAIAEMRLILAKIIYHFDIALDDSSRNWVNGQKAYAVWHKPDLHIHLKPTLP
ncbi:cytochrome P450 [Xylariaceae sp. FL0255]|nr:cytochrome P450 [Xylariaceae sp. FL0255]